MMCDKRGAHGFRCYECLHNTCEACHDGQKVHLCEAILHYEGAALRVREVRQVEVAYTAKDGARAMKMADREVSVDMSPADALARLVREMREWVGFDANGRWMMKCVKAQLEALPPHLQA